MPRQPDNQTFTARRLSILTLVALVASCSSDSPGPRFPSLPCTVTCLPSFSDQVRPDSANVLRGDTITVSAWICSEGCFPRPSNWTIAGSAVAPAMVGGTTQALSDVAQLLLTAAQAGEASVTSAALPDTLRRKTVPLFVADSAVIVSVALSTSFPGTQRTGSIVIAELRDAAGRLFRAWPTSWSVSDSSVVEIKASQFLGSGARTLTVKKSGTVDVTATFLGVQGTIRLNVQP